MESIPVTLAFLINWGWLRIGPSIHLNWVRRWRYAEVIPEDKIPAISGIPQKQVEENEQASKKRLGEK